MSKLSKLSELLEFSEFWNLLIFFKNCLLSINATSDSGSTGYISIIPFKNLTEDILSI